MSVYENNPTIVVTIYAIVVVAAVLLLLRFAKNRTRRVSNLRLIIQVAALVAIFMGLLIGPFNERIFLPLGPSPREHLLGKGLLANAQCFSVFAQRNSYALLQRTTFHMRLS